VQFGSIKSGMISPVASPPLLWESADSLQLFRDLICRGLQGMLLALYVCPALDKAPDSLKESAVL